MNSIESLIQKVQDSKPLDFGNIFSDSIELFKKTWIQGFLLQLFTIIVMLPLIIVMYVPLIGIIIAQAESGDVNSDAFDAFFAGMSLLYIGFLIVGVLVLGSISVALNAAFYRIMKRIDHDESVETSDFFYFLKGKYLSKTLMLILISMLIAIPSALLCYIPLIYVMVPMSYFSLIFAFNPEMSIGEIIKASFNIGNKKWLLSFGLLIVASLLAQVVGFILCGIGTLFTAPFVYHPIYLIYKNVVGFDFEKPINHIVE